MLGYIFFPIRLLLLLAWMSGGLLTVVTVFPWLGLRPRHWLIRNWSRVLMACCGVKIRCRGEPVREGAVLWVANHVSWIDIFVLDSVRAVSFIAKSDVRKWPLIGWLVAGAGTLFIERGRRHAVRAVGQQMIKCFNRGEAVGLFPEGTTSLGLDVAPFHTSLFEPALRAGVDVQPVALLFLHRGQRSTRYAFVGDQNLAHNIWNLLTVTGTVVELVFCPVASAAECSELGRVGVAENSRRQIREIVAGTVHAAPGTCAQPAGSAAE